MQTISVVKKWKEDVILNIREEVITPPVIWNGMRNLYDVTAAPFNAKGDGVTDDRAAIQAAIDACILTRGTLYFPNANNGYLIKDTLFFQPKAPNNQAFIDLLGQGHHGFQILYDGPSGKPATVIIGLKTGHLERMHVRLADGVSNSVCYEIGTSVASNSTSVFTFQDCSAELGLGVNNIGWRLGYLDGMTGSDISQIHWSNCVVWGPEGKIISGQMGWYNVGHNTLQLTWTAGSSCFVETGVRVDRGGSMYFFGYGSSHTAVDFDIRSANSFGVWGGRFEVGKRFLNVEQSQNHPTFTIANAMIETYNPTDGILFNFKSPGTLQMDAVSIHRATNYDSRMITLGTASENPFGSFSMRGGNINANDPFITSTGWRIKVENVVKLNQNFQSVGYFTNV